MALGLECHWAVLGVRSESMCYLGIDWNFCLGSRLCKKRSLIFSVWCVWGVDWFYWNRFVGVFSKGVWWVGIFRYEGLFTQGHVWIAPILQGKSNLISPRSGAVMCSACLCSLHDHWPWWNSPIWFQSPRRARSACPKRSIQIPGSTGWHQVFSPLQNAIQLLLTTSI